MRGLDWLAGMAGICLIAGFFAGEPAPAQGRALQPAELPPASFTDSVYIDSRGCMFLRAGQGASQSWVPRMTRARQPFCGFRPSLGNAAPAVRTTSERAVRAVVAPRTAMGPASGRPVPRGYEPAWDDGRLNPMRGPRSAAGDAAMYKIWSRSVPMVRLPAAGE